MYHLCIESCVVMYCSYIFVTVGICCIVSWIHIIVVINLSCGYIETSEETCEVVLMVACSDRPGYCLVYK